MRVLLLERFGQRRIRRAIRGYQQLRKANQLWRPAAVAATLTETRFDRCRGRVSPIVFGAAVGDAERVVRQYVLRRLGGQALNRALLLAFGTPRAKVVYKLPREWRVALRHEGMEVAELQSAARWGGYLALVFSYGVVTAAACVFGHLRSWFQRAPAPSGAYVYFEAMTASTLPQPGPDGRSHDVVTWYHQWDGRVRDLDAYCHSAKGVAPEAGSGPRILRVPSPALWLTGGARFLRLTGALTAAIALAAIDLVRGRWWHALLLSEAVTAIQMRLQSPDRVAREYLLHNSNWIYRPLWTYEAARHGGRVTFYFYSTNVAPFQPADGEADVPYGWRAANWPRYLVWDTELAAFVRRAVGDQAEIVEVGPIWFSTGAEVMEPIGSDAVAVFDVTPFRASRYVALGLDREFYVPATSQAFLQDTYDAAREAGCTMLWKQKRRIGKMAHGRYRHFSERLIAADGVTAVSADIAATRVLEAARMAISMPFTSTALIARHMGLPSCYYDPTGLLQPDDRAAHGIPLIQGREALVQWVKAHGHCFRGV